ncbi:MAG TPA: hypothetical protein VH189_09060, partial [Rhizomicrobium sp.]|nr:hypothetical protein [Rhizomicrobium sp.]
ETRDSKAIRRAYAGRLRAIDQQKDPASFQRLRWAYEWALNFASGAQAAPLIQPVPAAPQQTQRVQAAPSGTGSPPDQPEQQAPRELTPDEVLTQSLVERMRQAMEAGRYDIAFDAYDKGSAQGILPFGYREYLLDAMMDALVRDPGLSVDQFGHYLARAGWREPPASIEPVSRARQFAMARQDADAWFVGLQSLAAGDGPTMHTNYTPKWMWRWLPKFIERRNAKLFFGGAAIPKLSRMGADDLRRKLFDYRRREAWLKGRIDPEDAARACRVLEQYDRYGFLVDPCVTFVIGMIWLGPQGAPQLVVPLVMLATGIRALVTWRRQRRKLAGLKDLA